MTTAIQPRLDVLARQRRAESQWAQAPAASERENKLQLVDELDELGTRWRLALDAAQTALEAADPVLSAGALQGRLGLLKAERATTAHLLNGLARDFHVEAWLSDLEVPARNGYRLLATEASG